MTPEPLWRRAWDRLRALQGPWLLIAGSVWDFATLRRVDRLTDHVLLLSYLVGLSAIVVLELRLARGAAVPGVVRRRRAWLHGAAQFLFGGLLSAYVVYFTKSASLGRSFAFLGLLIGLLVFNEVADRRLRPGSVRVALLFACVFVLLLVLLPVWTGVWVGFLPAGVLALAWIAGVLLAAWVPSSDRSAWSDLGAPMTACVSVLGVLVALLELGLVPPVPLALAAAGTYHHVERVEEGYALTYEDPGWRVWWTDDRVFRRAGDERVYCFTSVFAPTGMALQVVHRWQRWDPAAGWTGQDAIPFEVRGGRDGGFRGYTWKSRLEPGPWRVTIETADGRELGRVRFDLEQSAPLRPLVRRIAR